VSHDDTIGALVQAYVQTQCSAILEAREAISARDESVVHPVRVAIRRLRATLRTFAAVYDAETASNFADELRWAGNLLGDVRDLQVLAERFAHDDRTSSPATYRAIAEEIERDRAEAWHEVADGLAGSRGVALFRAIEQWRGDPPFTRKAERSAERAKKPVAKADARATRRLSRVSDAASADAGERLHDARKAAKRHRYAVELAQPVLGVKAERTIERREALQDALGAHQDAVVALAYLQQLRLDTTNGASAEALNELVARTRASAEDVAGVLRETEKLRD
jgi:CHAD domain-containing protein